MNLYLLTQEENNGYDTWDSCVVCAESDEEAKRIYPDGKENGWEIQDFIAKMGMSWASCPANVQCELIGVAKESMKKGVIISSFNAG